MTRLHDLKAGDILYVTGEFDCMRQGEPRQVRETYPNRLCVDCSHGEHFLDGQVRGAHDDELVGLTLAKELNLSADGEPLWEGRAIYAMTNWSGISPQTWRGSLGDLKKLAQGCVFAHRENAWEESIRRHTLAWIWRIDQEEPPEMMTVYALELNTEGESPVLHVQLAPERRLLGGVYLHSRRAAERVIKEIPKTRLKLLL